MQRVRSSGLMLLTALAGMAGSGIARADDSAAAQALFDQAKKAMAAHRYADACPKLEESLRLQEAVGTLLNLADCYEHEGKLASAWSKFLEVASRARASGQGARARLARDRAASLAPNLSNLVVDVPSSSRVAGLEIRRDGTPVGEAEWGERIPADAGTHTLEASAPGRKPWSQSVQVMDGATTARVTVPDLAPLPVEPKGAPVAAIVPPESPPAPTLSAQSKPSHVQGLKVAAVVVGGLGVVGVGVGAVFGLMSLGKHNDASRICPQTDSCANPDAVTASRQAVNFGNVSTAAFVVGGAGLAGGTLLWFLAPKHGAPMETSGLIVGPTQVGWRGVW